MRILGTALVLLCLGGCSSDTHYSLAEEPSAVFVHDCTQEHSHEAEPCDCALMRMHEQLHRIESDLAEIKVLAVEESAARPRSIRTASSPE